jgi:hypothetical protein
MVRLFGMVKYVEALKDSDIDSRFLGGAETRMSMLKITGD